MPTILSENAFHRIKPPSLLGASQGCTGCSCGVIALQIISINPHFVWAPERLNHCCCFFRRETWGISTFLRVWFEMFTEVTKHPLIIFFMWDSVINLLKLNTPPLTFEVCRSLVCPMWTSKAHVHHKCRLCLWSWKTLGRENSKAFKFKDCDCWRLLQVFT